MENITVILEQKQPHFNRISPQSTVSDALCRMACLQADYLIVMDEDDQFLGLITDHDIATRVIFHNKDFHSITVRSVMNTQLPIAETAQSVEDCMKLMKSHHVRYIPVFREHSFAGIISAQDILEEAVKQRQEIFDEKVERGRALSNPY